MDQLIAARRFSDQHGQRPGRAVELDTDPRIVAPQGPKVTEPEVAGLGTRLRPSGDHRAEFRCGRLNELPVLVPDREHRLLSRRGVGLLHCRRELKPRILILVQRNIAGEIFGAQPELAIGDGARGQRCAIDEPPHRQATRDEEQSGELDGQPQLQ